MVISGKYSGSKQVCRGKTIQGTVRQPRNVYIESSKVGGKKSKKSKLTDTFKSKEELQQLTA